MSSIDILEERRKKINEEVEDCFDDMTYIISDMNSIIDEQNRVLNIMHHSNEILENLDTEFKKRTGLTKKDMKFLMTATGLQVARQYLLTQFPERLNNSEAAKKVKGNKKESSDRKHQYYKPSLKEIITNPVPFDANIGSNGALKGGGPLGHRVTAIGHDPVLGYIFGTANIATSTLTTNKMESYHIATGDGPNGGKVDVFKNHAHTSKVLSYTMDKLFDEGKEGKKKIACSLAKERVHLKSDLYTADSLPLPIISVLNGKLAGELADKGLDMANVKTVGKQFKYAALINTIIGMIHQLDWDETIEPNKKLYEVRTRKIIKYSDLIATTSNLIVVGIDAAFGSKKMTKYFDLGGLFLTINRLISDSDFSYEVKKEFLFGSFEEMVNGDDFNFQYNG